MAMKLGISSYCLSHKLYTKEWTLFDIMDWAKEHDDSLLRYKEPEINKKAVADALKAGAEIPTRGWPTAG